MKGLFITATDTEVGKTTIACALARRLKERGVDLGVIKPVSAGGVPNDDVLKLVEAAGVDDPMNLVNPCAYQRPLAPLVAAEKEGKTFDRQAVLAAKRQLESRHGFLLVEGAGGLLVPLAAGYTVLDLAKEFSYPVLLVARAGLGTVNHSLMSIELLRARELELVGVVLNGARGEEAEADNPSMIEEFGNTKVLAVVPFIGGGDVVGEVKDYLGEVVEKVMGV